MTEPVMRWVNPPKFNFTKAARTTTILMFGKQETEEGLEDTFFITRDGDGAIQAVFEDNYCPFAPVICELQNTA